MRLIFSTAIIALFLLGSANASESFAETSAIDKAVQFEDASEVFKELYGILDGGTDYETFMQFVAARIQKNPALETAFKKARAKNVRIFLQDSFYVSSGWVAINVKAPDSQIIEFLCGTNPCK